jgi:cellulose synthase operon protein B
MNRMLRQFLSAVMLASLLSSLMFTVAPAAPSAQESGNEAEIRFDMIGQTDTLMRGPYATMNTRFGLPANWAYTSGANLQLIVTSTLINEGSQPIANGQFIDSTLNVTFNDNEVAVIPLVAGPSVTYDIPIPATALESRLNDGRHELRLFLDAGNDCTDTSRHTSIVVSAASHFTIPYSEQTPALDLTTLPRPIFQRDSIFPVNTTLVVPDQPTAQELQAALTVASSFGRMSSGEMPVHLVPMSKMTPDMRTDSQLIFIGKSSTLSLLQGVALPAPLSNNAFAPTGMQAEDGILQIAVSPWNTGRALLVVGGNTDLGVVKAAQALSSGGIQTIGDRTMALVANVLPPTAQGSNVTLQRETQTLAELGYGIITMNDVGRKDSIVQFTLPPGFVPAADTYLDLTFNNSGLLDFSRSGLTVFMNHNLIGSVQFSEETASTVTKRIRIPPSSLSTGTNELRFQVDLAPISQCSILDFSNLWFSILPESALHLPLRPATAGSVQLRDMSSYPYPFVSEPTLSNLAFVLPKSDPSAWNAAAQIASKLGNQSAGALFNLGVAYDGEIPEDVRNGRNLIVIGLPSELQLLNELKDSLPAPFEEGTNVAVLHGQQVAYRFPADADLGFLELLASPWNSERVILAVAGTTQTGVEQAGETLTNSLFRSKLRGNFVLVNGDSLSVADTRTGLGLSNVTDATQVDGGAPPAQVPETGATAAVPETPLSVLTSDTSWIPYAVGGLAIMILFVLLVALLTRRRLPN